jgi:hypothetical protein
MNEPTEAQIQADFFRWIDMHSKRFPELLLCYAIPNGSHKSPAARGLHRRTGLKAGVPDVHLPVTSDGWHFGQKHRNGLWLEFKAKRGQLSEAQKGWIERLELAGHCVLVVRSWTEAANAVIDYLQIPVEKFRTIDFVKEAVK